MTALSFDRAAYAIELTAFRSASVAVDGKADKLGSASMAALLLGELSPLALAITFYDAFAPSNAKGKAVEPKEADDGTIRVRSLEQPTCKGSAGARTMLERVLYCYANRATSAATSAAVDAFAIGDKFAVGNRTSKALAMLQSLIKSERLDIAHGEAGETAAPAGEEADEAIVAEAMTGGERLSAALAMLKGVESAEDASERLVLVAIAAEIDRIGAVVETVAKAA